MSRIALVSIIILLSALAPFSVRGQDKEKNGESDVPGGGGLSGSTLNQLAEAAFNFHDRNGDGFLSKAEMPAQLKSELSKWDKNGDNLISLDEFKAYYVALKQNRKGPGSQQSNPIAIIIEDEDIETRPVGQRPGKVPRREPPPREHQYHLPDVPKPLDLGFDSRPGGGVVGTSLIVRDLVRL